jgi:2-polyprenyl-6-methoxyphenol hydroxylase-like FAD-dependent oxidoreductase
MASPDIADVLVIGAGPVGLTLACELQRHGVKVRLVERREQPLAHPNAAVVHVRTLEILSAMGAVAGFIEEGYALPGIHVRAFGKRLGFVDVGGIDSPYPQPRTLGQQITERLLDEHFARLGGRIERQVEAVALEQDDNEVRVKLHHLAEKNRPESAVARWVVGCEGSASLTRRTLGIPFVGEHYTGKEFLQVDARVRWSHPHGYGYQFITENHVLMFFPYNGEGHYRIICARDDHDPENKDAPSIEEMQNLAREIADPVAELYDPVWFNRFRTGHRFAATFRKGRAFLAGDAGHVHIPIGGQGMNYGIHDSFNLGWKLAAVIKGEAHPALLDTYMAERHPTDEALIRGTDRGFHLLVKPNAATQMALRLFGAPLLNLSVVQKQIRNTLAEMNVAYTASFLSEDHGGDIGGPAPGDRAPDALIVHMPERQTMRLFEVFHGTRWSLLLFAGSEPTISQIESLEKASAALTASYGTRVAIHLILCNDPPVPVHENWAAHILMDRERFAHEKYGIHATPVLYLVRPDWYIGFRGQLEHQDQLTAYLKRVLTQA